MGVKEQLIFPEIEYEKIDKIRGMDIIFVTTAKSDEEAKLLLPKAYEAAKKGSDNTTTMLAKFGRIAFKGEESRTILDPGSVFASLMIKTLAEVLG